MNARRLMLGMAAGTGALLALTWLPAGVALAAGGVSVPCSGSGGGAAGLIAAINAANTGSGGTIKLAAGCTYRLTAPNNSGQLGPNGLPVITSAITIRGNGATITRRSTAPFRILEVTGPGGNLTLQHVTITGGNTPGPGGAMFNLAGRLVLDASVVTGNASEGGMMSAGGGIASGTLQNGPAGDAGAEREQGDPQHHQRGRRKDSRITPERRYSIPAWYPGTCPAAAAGSPAAPATAATRTAAA